MIKNQGGSSPNTLQFFLLMIRRLQRMPDNRKDMAPFYTHRQYKHCNGHYKGIKKATNTEEQRNPTKLVSRLISLPVDRDPKTNTPLTANWVIRNKLTNDIHTVLEPEISGIFLHMNFRILCGNCKFATFS